MKTSRTVIAALSLALAGALVAPFSAIAGELILKKGDRVAIVGDSITEQAGYSKFIEVYLLACVPELDLTVYSFGWGGEKAPGFAIRMENDFVPWQPTLVTSCFGMNDGLYRPYTNQIGEAYEAGTRRIQTRCKALGARMIEGGPGAVDSETWKKDEPEADLYYNETLAQLSGIAGQLATENGFVFANLHPLMMKVMQDAKAARGKDYPVCGNDGIHPGANGHLVMAYAFLKSMGLDGNLGTITIDLKGKASATDGHRVLSAISNRVEIESTRYPFCFSGGGNDTNGMRSILPFLPFNHDLNRFMLVVTNLSTPTAEVTWGNTSKTFTKAELQAGINLADAFLDNPFAAAFGELDQLVGQKQYREMLTIKGTITNFRPLLEGFPGDPEVTNALATLRGKLFARNAEFAARVRAAVKPVIHTIQVTPK